MTLFDYVLNLIERIKEAIQHSDDNLQTGLTYRQLDWANVISPVSVSQTSTWTFTAPKDGQLLIPFFSQERTYIGMFVNNHRIFDLAMVNVSGGGIYAVPVTLILSEGDVLRVGELNTKTWIGTATTFVPFVGGGNS